MNLDAASLAHRPWRLPAAPWVMRMTWSDLLFAHWGVAPEVIRPWLPQGLELDLLDGRAWLGIVPFRMSDVAPRCIPVVPGLSNFLELNLRTYVSAGGKPGVWFFSLDAASRFAVRAARATFHLPYFDAVMHCKAAGSGVQYRSERTHRGVVPATLTVDYEPVGPVFRSQVGTLEHWLTERYCLYVGGPRGGLRRGEIHHEPWPLQRAEARFEQLDMTRLLRSSLPLEKPHLLFARRIEVVAWAPTGVRQDHS